MVDLDKVACHTVAEQGYLAGLWPESYLTWEFLKEHPKVMEPGYLFVNWNHILGMYCRKNYLRSLVIEPAEWEHLNDPPNLLITGSLPRSPGSFTGPSPWLYARVVTLTARTNPIRMSTWCRLP